MSSNIIKFIIETGGFNEFDETKSVSLVNQINDQLVVLLESAITDANEDLLSDILSFAFDIRNSDDIAVCSEKLALYFREEIDFNYLEEVVEGVIFLVTQTYDLPEDRIRDEDGGLPVSKTVSELSALM